MPKNECFSFAKGLKQVPHGKINEVKAAIKIALKITAKSTFSRRLNGHVEPKITEKEAIEDIFFLYNITDIWGV